MEPRLEALGIMGNRVVVRERAILPKGIAIALQGHAESRILGDLSEVRIASSD